jgi:hypothetical protein
VVKGIHESFFRNRESPHIALKKITVADAVKKLFPSETKMKVEATKGKIEAYAFDDPYQFTKDVLLPQATNGKILPYCFLEIYLTNCILRVLSYWKIRTLKRS